MATAVKAIPTMRYWKIAVQASPNRYRTRQSPLARLCRRLSVQGTECLCLYATLRPAKCVAISAWTDEAVRQNAVWIKGLTATSVGEVVAKAEVFRVGFFKYIRVMYAFSKVN
ncbi:hypothetical protein CLV78_101500 [Aliiruegeria haliotis]|uniref:Uncharacterized protein n=1 Tax=Aliiruegeria haliotis TaxID=1280846 RepID=A0A2T0RZ00_9RHOB|nr:hypothetical protein [Aliiruegeria haliotis]PRY26405.1 hypothetical protein CLV78_101500 [Aliiruegeria haliotis]